jgi:chromosome partitioning protein
VIIPVSATVWSTTGLLKFTRWIEEHRQDEVISARLLGLVATMVDPRTRIGRGLLSDLGSSELPSFVTNIPRRIGAKDAALDRAVVGEAGADPDMTEAYKNLTTEVVERLSSLRAGGPPWPVDDASAPPPAS